MRGPSSWSLRLARTSFCFADGTKVYPPFLRWLVRGPEWWEQIAKFLNVGAVFDSLKCADVPNFRLHIPPLDEQRAIAQILGTLDDKIELNRRMSETLEAIARALFKSWFVDFDPVRAKAERHDPRLPKHIADLFPDSFEESELGEIPAGWDAVELGELLEFAKGKKPHSTQYEPREGLRPVILIEAFDNGASAFASPVGLVEARTEDVLMVMDGASSGRVETGHQGIVGSTIAKLIPRRSAPGHRFLYYLLKELEPQTREHLTGTSIPHADKGWIVRQVVAFPKSTRLAGHFEALAGAIRGKIEANTRESHMLSGVRDALLPKLLSGEVSVPNAERIIARSV